MTTKNAKQTHTPGPWDADDFDGVYHYIRSDDGRLVVKTATCFPNGRTPKEDAANARLIAAAPDLLALVKATLYSWDERGMGEHEHDRHIEAMRAAIAKAEGK